MFDQVFVRKRSGPTSVRPVTDFEQAERTPVHELFALSLSGDKSIWLSRELFDLQERVEVPHYSFPLVFLGRRAQPAVM